MSLEMTACRSSGFAIPPLMYSRVRRPCVMNSGINDPPVFSALSAPIRAVCLLSLAVREAGTYPRFSVGAVPHPNIVGGHPQRPRELQPRIGPAPEPWTIARVARFVVLR